MSAQVYASDSAEAYDEVDDGSPRLAIVDIVTKPRRVDDRQFDLELLLFQLGLDDVCELYQREQAQ